MYHSEQHQQQPTHGKSEHQFRCVWCTNVALFVESDCVECLNPIRGGHACLKKERKNNIIGGANNELSSTTLGVKCVGNTYIGWQPQHAGDGVIKLTTIVTLHVLDGTPN